MPRKLTGKTFICQVCGTNFYRPPSEIAKGCTVTCGKKCWSIWRLRGETRSCLECGKAFYARRSQISQGYANYCSKPCETTRKKFRQSFLCAVCGSEFERTRWQIKKGYTKVCSQDCMTIWRRGHREGSQLTHMFTPWQKKAWKKDACEWCGSKEHLELDHIVPRFAGGKATKKNSQTLCLSCNRRKYWEFDLPRYRPETTLRLQIR